MVGVGKQCYTKGSAKMEGEQCKHIHTIIPIAAEACPAALNPSERFSVTERPKRAVSEDKRLISSPVLVLSKKATSCFKREENIVALRRFTILCPKTVKRYGNL